MSNKLAEGLQGGCPPWKEGQAIDLKIAHWCVFAPRLSGMYETVREIIQAENMIDGVLAGFVETPDPKSSQAKIDQALQGGRVDAMFPHLRTQDWGWAQKWADIHVIHTTIPKQIGELKPKAFYAHGTPESCMTQDVQRDTESFIPAADWINRCEVSFCTSHRALECWGPFEYQGDKLHLIPKGIDLSWWTRSPTVQDVDGDPSVLYGEIWRDMKTPFHLIYAVNELYKSNPKIRLNVWGLNMGQQFWRKMIDQGQFDKFLGKRGLRGVVDYPSHWYSRGDVLMSPGIYGDVSRVGQEAAACLPEDTMVDTIHGKEPIQEIQLGELVPTHRNHFRPVTKLYKRMFSGKLIQVRTGNSLISPTKNHPLLTEKGWTQTGDLKYSKGLHGWSPRWGRIFGSQNNEELSAQSKLLIITCRRFASEGSEGSGVIGRSNDRDSTERSTDHSSEMVRENFWRISDTKTGSPRALLGSSWKEGCFGISHNVASLSESQEQSGNSNARSMQQTTCLLETTRARASDLRGLGMVFETGGKNLLHQFSIQPSPLETFLGSFRPDPIFDVREIGYTGYVYNLGISDDYSYIANDLIVHNCGCPVIGWDVDPYGDQHAFRYAKAFSIHDLADTIKEVYNEVLDDREGVARRCRESAEKNFDVNNTAAQMVKILRETVANR